MTATTADEALAQAKQKMDAAVNVTREEMGGVRTGRASPSFLSRLTFEYYGTQTPLQQMASMSVPEPRLLVIQPFDKTTIPAIEKAIQQSDLGINPSNDGQVIRLAFPPLTEERRKELVKVIHHRAEEGRVAVRNVRRHSKEELERLERDAAISEDELRRAEKELQKLTDDHISLIDDALSAKERELLEV